jgi:hypothetical protein
MHARRERIQARLQEMTCVRASAPASGACLRGWGPNEDGTRTLWLVGPGPSLSESVTIRDDVDPADFEQLQALLEACTKSLHVEANALDSMHGNETKHR